MIEKIKGKYIIITTMLGVVLGILIFKMDFNYTLYDVSNALGIWIGIITMLIIVSSNCKIAMRSTMCILLSMLFTYYYCRIYVFGIERLILNNEYIKIIIWVVLSLFCGLVVYILKYFIQSNKYGVLLYYLPISALIAEILFFATSSIVTITDLIFVFLIYVLGIKKYYRFNILSLIIVIPSVLLSLVALSILYLL